MKNVIKESPVTIFLLALTTLVFIAMQVIYFGNATSNQAIFNTGGMYGAYVSLFPSQLWRLVTPIFVHIGWEHFFFNALTLYFCWSNSRADLGTSQIFSLVCSIRNCW